MSTLVVKACDDCGTPVHDVDYPEFKGHAWLCYWCHCSREGIDHKTRLNEMADAIKFGAYAHRAARPELFEKGRKPV